MATRSNYGEVRLLDGTVFRWTNRSDNLEICGWVERDHAIVPGSYGWYRTEDSTQAARVAASNAGTEIAPAQLVESFSLGRKP